MLAMSVPVSINYEKRLKKIRARMEEERIDVYVGTRLKSLTHICGCFIPWRSAVVFPKEGARCCRMFLSSYPRLPNGNTLPE